MLSDTGYKDFIEEIQKPKSLRKGFIRKRKQPFSISDTQINQLYERYFSPLMAEEKTYTFNVNVEDFEMIVYLLRVHFQLWIEIEGNNITILKDFPRRFRLTQEVKPENHWFTPKSFPKGTILYYGLDHYSVCSRAKGIPLSETPPNRELNIITPVVQINYDFIEVVNDFL
jgi:hypothetical protein